MIVSCPNCETRFDLGFCSREDMPCPRCKISYELSYAIMKSSIEEVIKDLIGEEAAKVLETVTSEIKEKIYQETIEDIIIHFKDEYNLSEKDALIKHLQKMLKQK